MKVNLLTHIPLNDLMDLKIDYAFKQLFGNEQTKEITISFLNAILQHSGYEPIKDLTFNNIEAGGEYKQDKQSRLDLLVLTEKNKKIHVEIQFTIKYDMFKGSLSYWSEIYRSQLSTVFYYKKLNNVLTI